MLHYVLLRREESSVNKLMPVTQLTISLWGYAFAITTPADTVPGKTVVVVINYV